MYTSIPVGVNAPLGFARLVERLGQQARAGDVLRGGGVQRVYLARHAKVFQCCRDGLRFRFGEGG